MGSQGPGRKRTPNRNGLTAEEDALNIIAREAETRLAAKRAARAEAREIRMRELERQQKEIYQVQKKYYGLDNLDNKWGDIEQWMEDNERYTRHSQRRGSMSDDEEQTSFGSRGNLQSSECSGFFSSCSRTPSKVSSRCQSPVLDDQLQGVFLEKGSFRPSALTTATLTSLGETSSCIGSGDSSATADTEVSKRELKEIHDLKDQIQDVETKYVQSLKEAKDSLAEMEDKYRKAMVSNAQFDNEKSNLMYQVDNLKDSLIELEELLAESRREFEEKSKDLERERQAYSVLQFQFSELKETLKKSDELLTEMRQLRLTQDGFVREISDLQETIEWKNKKIGALEKQKEYSDSIRNERDELRDEVVQLRDILKKHGIVLGPDLSTDKEVGDDVTDESSCTQIQERSSVLEIRLRKLVDERANLIEQIERLKGQLEEKKKKHDTDNVSRLEGEMMENGTDANVMDLQRDANRQISDLKFKLVKSEQEVTALEQNATRLEGQVNRYKSAAENAEKVEDELKTEKRKLQRELRSALDKLEELEASNSHLTKRLEKMKANRGTAASP
ncbi:leucine-rich repeat flightless-interacting protein 2 isoform X8 [Salminus brasiliensis]|uniref:leucine-rich repeat flightless-interacting protein 2 isoform X8 n=1 Tax=Salminus brasiliensis TaxID=930266 RepID=UPI003B8394E5